MLSSGASTSGRSESVTAALVREPSNAMVIAIVAGSCGAVVVTVFVVVVGFVFVRRRRRARLRVPAGTSGRPLLTRTSARELQASYLRALDEVQFASVPPRRAGLPMLAGVGSVKKEENPWSRPAAIVFAAGDAKEDVE